MAKFRNELSAASAASPIDFRREHVLLLEPHRQGLIAARSLGRAGCRVVYGRSKTGTDSFPTFSRYVSEVWTHPDLSRTEEFLDALRTYLRTRPQRMVVMPAGEVSLTILSKHATALAEFADLAIPPPTASLRCLDKPETAAVAAEAGVPVPPSEGFEGPDRWEEKAARIGYPCVLKSRNSFRKVHGSKAYRCNNPAELRKALEGMAPEDHEALVIQKFVDGYRHNCHFAAFRGRVFRYFEQKVLRTDRADGSGYGVEGISIEPTPLLRAYTERLAEKLDYTGIGCAQFLVGEAEETPYFLEINPRLDATTALPYGCGVEFPLLALECAIRVRDGLPPPKLQEGYPIGERNYWLYGDIVSWLGALRLGVDADVDARERARAMALALARRPHHLNWDWQDPVPALYLFGTTFPPMLGRRLLALGRKAARR